MSKNNETILKGLHVMSWIIFLGLCIEAGALIFNWIYAYFNPVVSQNLYKGLDLSDMYENQYPHFTGLMSLVVMGAILKAYLFYLVIKIFLKLNWVKPFDMEIANRIEKISYEAVAIAVISYIAQKYTTHLIHKGFEVSDVSNFWSDTPAFLMMAAILYIIAQVFKKGIELQNENDLTV